MLDYFLIYYLTIFGMQLNWVKSHGSTFTSQSQKPKKIRKGFPSAGGLLIKAFSSTTYGGKSEIKINNNCAIITFMNIYSFSPLGWYYACKISWQFALKLKHHMTRNELYSSAVENDSSEISHCHNKHKSGLLVPISASVREEQGAPYNIIGHTHFSPSPC